MQGGDRSCHLRKLNTLILVIKGKVALSTFHSRERPNDHATSQSTFGSLLTCCMLESCADTPNVAERGLSFYGHKWEGKRQISKWKGNVIPDHKNCGWQISAREESDVRQTRLSIPSRARALPAKGVSDLDSAPMRKRLHRVADGGGSLLFRPHSGVTVFVTFVNGVAHSCGYNFTITIGMWAFNQSVMQ